MNVLIKEYENHVLVITPCKFEDFSNCDGNITVALAITANARIKMSEFKNNPNIKLFYTDTDSEFIQGTLPDSVVHSKKLGFWSLENQYIYSLFLGPKTYACLDIHGKAYSKIKGYSSNISIGELYKRVNENGGEALNRKRWRTFIGEAKVLVKGTTYDLMATANKRNLVFKNGRLSGTTNRIIKIVDSKNVCET